MIEAPSPITDPVDTRSLVTHTSLVRDLRALGVAFGDKLLVHTSLSSLGFVVGGGRTVIEALLESVGENGTVMMPTYSGENSDPAEWQYPPVPLEWTEIIRDETPAYDPLLTPSRRMGSLPELFRHYPGARRSLHPQSSFTAAGRDAKALTENHALDYRFGPKSPLGKLYELQGKSLMLGASPRTCSLYYLSEHHIGRAPIIRKSAPIMSSGGKKWVEYSDLEYTNFWFLEATDYLLESGIILKSPIGDADCICLPAKHTIDAVTRWRLANGV